MRLLPFFLFYVLSGCMGYNPVLSENGSGSAYTKDCSVPEDQAKTLYGRWSQSPIPIALKRGDFSSSDMTAITAAAKTWNDFFLASKGRMLFDYGGSEESPRQVDQPSASSAQGACTQRIIDQNRFVYPVVIYKNTQWSPLSKSSIAFTHYCVMPRERPFPSLFNAVIELNYTFHFVEGQKQPDLQSILLHELGHVAGLDHSCEFSKKDGIPVCNSEMNPLYRSASMFPDFSFNAANQGERRRTTNSNDQSRLNCLY